MSTYFLAKYRRSEALTGLEIARRLGLPIVTPRTFPTRVIPGDVVVNWGRRPLLTDEETNRFRWLNAPYGVAIARDKLATLIRLTANNVPTLQYTTSPQIAAEWGDRVYARHFLHGSSGRGIEIVEPGESMPRAPLYTRAFPTYAEFRVHCTWHGPFFIQQKRRMRKERRPDTFNPLVRSYGNGWVFANQGVEAPALVTGFAHAAVVACGLEFGAVDVLMAEDGRVAVCEVNSAPAVSGTTVDKYVEALGSLL